MVGQPKHNALIHEKSVYLFRHGENPVEWLPWGEEAFNLAKSKNLPVFLSCGYSSCHWCRVMEEESFMDEVTAKIINENFIPVKMDKDEYPDIDKEYQFYLQSTGETGGWPLTIFLNHDKEPFFAGTYFPKNDSPDKPSFKTVLENIKKIWKITPAEIEKVIKTRRGFMESFLQTSKPLVEGDMAVEYRKTEFVKIFDAQFGGFRNGAKFPYIPAMDYLFEKREDVKIGQFLLQTANVFCVSGINDHLFGGFFRYTVDRKWSMPHFEKMLSDNAQISRFLLKMFDVTGDKLFLMTAKKAIDYVIHNMMTEYGVLNSVDADSLTDKGLLSEGYFYKVTDRDFSALSATELTNFQKEAGVANGVIYLKTCEYIKAAATEVILEKVGKRIASVKTPPRTDSKVIAGNNFMFVTTLLDCFEISGEEWYLSQATALFQKLKFLLVDGFSVYRGCYGPDFIPHKTLEDHVYYFETLMKFFEVTKEKEFLISGLAVASEIDIVFVKEGLPYLDTAKQVLETFDDDKPNPAALYMLILKKYAYALHLPISDSLTAFAEDRAARFPTGHPTIIRALEN